MKNIDFLPDLYRQREALRQARIWWCAVVVIFGTAIGLAAGAQFWLRYDIGRQVGELSPAFNAAQAQVRELAALQSQISQQARAASLFTFLEGPWPRTQILAELIKPLPHSVRLTQIQIADEEITRSQPQAGQRRRGRKEEETGPKLSPAEEDLTRLRTESEQRQTVVKLDGQTGDVAPLHQYVSALSRSPLVASAQITSLEVAPGDSPTAPTNFSLCVVIKAGHGAAAGLPIKPGAQSAQAVTSLHAQSRDRRLAQRGDQP